MRNRLYRVYKSVWFFPIIIGLGFAVFVAFGISGTSSGLYSSITNGSGKKDTNLLLGKPRPIRSDEWEVVTQLTKAQAAENFPRYNQNISLGNDVSVVMDLPYREWSVLFKPQNLSFFVLPFSQAFAFRWWSMLVLLVIGTYFLCLYFLPKKRLVSALIAMCFACSPFIMWWFQTVTIAPLAYAVLGILICLHLLDKRTLPYFKNYNKLQTGIYIIVLAYVLSCFALVLYPPFQIPVAIIAGLFVAGVYIDRLRLYDSSEKNRLKKLILALIPIVIAGVCAIAVVGTFVVTRKEAVKAIRSTDYPGVRYVKNGGGQPAVFFNGFLAPQFQSDKRAARYFTNQSEASTFHFFGLMLLVPLLLTVLKNNRRINKDRFTVIFVTLGVIVLLSKFFVTQLTPFSKLLQLTTVPTERSIIGIGFASLLLILLHVKQKNNDDHKSLATSSSKFLYTMVFFVVFLWTGFFVRATNPGFIVSVPKLLLFAAIYAIILYLLLIRTHRLAFVLYLLFSLVSVAAINPLYKDTLPLKTDPVVSAIQQSSTDEDVWGVMDEIILENYPAVAGRRSITGVAPYPNNDFWRETYPNEPKIDYNRYAHVILAEDSEGEARLLNPQFDVLVAGFSCNATISKKITRILTPRELKMPCLTETRRIALPEKTLFIYKVE